MPRKLDFMTPTTLKVLETFFSNPIEDFHEREVMRRSCISKGSANAILRKLTKLELLNREKRGRMVFYRFNIKNIVARHLKILFNIWELKEIVDKLKDKSKKIVLFGSCAEGTDVEDSDIDILVIAGERKTIKKIISGFNRKGKRMISHVILDFNEFTKMRREDAAFYERVDRGIVLWEEE